MSPLAVQGLTNKSSQEEIKKSISDSIAQCVAEGKPQDQCVAIAYRYAEEKTGRSTFNLSQPGA